VYRSGVHSGESGSRRQLAGAVSRDAPGPRPSLGFVDGWEGHADRPALITDRETVTYGELAARVTAEMELVGFARRLVLIQLENTVSAIVSYLAALRAGHVVLIASDAGTRESLVERYDPDVVVGPNADNMWQVTERRAGTRHDLHPDLALLVSTSGSTGSPKLVRLSYENLDSNAKSIAEYLGIGCTDRAMTSLPLSYCYGLSVLHSHLTQGAAAIVTGLSVVDPGFWNLARTAQATAFAGVPYTFELLDRVGFAELDLPSLRYITQAGGKLGADRVRRFAELGRRRGWDLVVMYGQTEATARMAYLPVDRVVEVPQAVGVPIPGGRFTIDDDGELIYHGPNVMLGYAQSPEDFALGRTIDYLRTGDLARRGPHGLYEIVGRRSRFLKLFGLRVDLDQLEHRLRRDGIQALCAGDDTGLIVAVAKSTPDPAAVIRANVGLPAAAVRTVVLDELPRNANGKPDYAAVQRAAGPPPETAAELAVTADGVHALYREILKADEVSDTDTFVSLGGDSLSFVETSQRLERQLGALPADWHLLTVAELEAGARHRPRGPFRWMETSVVLRAVAIVLICANHIGLTDVRGGAHVLLAAAGYSFARFQVNAVASSGRIRPLFHSIARIAVPSMAVIAVAYVVTHDYAAWNMLLIEHLFAPDIYPSVGGGGRWDYWFIEVLVEILVLWAALLSIPAVRGLERAQPFGFAVAFLGVCLALRFHTFVRGESMSPFRPHTVVWLFALGWAAVRATRVSHRLLLTVAAVCSAMLPGFFDDERGRQLVIVGGLLLLIWVTRVPMLVALRRLTVLLAGASLWIYLTQYQTYRFIAKTQSLFDHSSAASGSNADQWSLRLDLRLAAATVTALAVGVLAWKAYERGIQHLARFRTRRATFGGLGKAL
jgi:acyl-CoA synthetase (AMP-forming)/AMP-acid ligase II